ncbi:Serine/threonine-protein phosphatase 6 regulatory ankyrin repeat subunit C [Fusarium oxysporum f. sp. rapae]|uniref:Serine/threonine-protein phosphatase 6 regulatory ankyrin repeat subunit C n=1 Tax=Fusarium oxysporum f. sp. rapae TaxID=485398 RepID=A0A8J5TWW5_FUSOX|nr:Serine/threonine-protein phosphatase 6 regulatory ankyrin repeat subunit C [Fusarium oxysporum f. sp. rapae]
MSLPPLSTIAPASTLSWAAQKGYEEVVKLLLEKEGVDPDSKDDFGRTPLSRAAQNGYEEVVKLLLEKDGVDSDSNDNDDVTPLSWAARYGHVGVAELLIARGAKYNSKDKSGHMPLWWATENLRSTVVKLLLEHSRITLHELVREGERTQICLLLSEGNIDSRNSSNQTTLHIAVLNEQTEIAEELLSRGADINAEDGQGCTCLRLAIDKKSPDLINLLLEYSADPRGIEYREWLSAYGKQNLATVWLTERCAGELPVRIVADREIPESLQLWRLPRKMLIFDPHSTLPWEKRWLKNAAAKLKISTDELPQGVKYSATASLPTSIAFYDGKNSPMPIGISWTMMPPAISNGESSWKSIAHLSVLPYGWMPDNGIEFFALFIAELERRWSALCDDTKSYLHTCEFAWVSINESFKSTSTATSTKRLSWVTFIFLPAMFASSLFGMNVNMLKDNPDWRWYIPVVATSLLLTITAWLIFKYIPIETWMEEWADSFHQKLKGQHAVQSLMIHDKTKTNVGKTQTDDANLLHDTSPV